MLRLLPLERSTLRRCRPALGNPHGEVELFPYAWSVFEQTAPHLHAPA